jgi:hypothetical protein
MSAKGVPGFHTTVCNDRVRKRGHQNLFRKLAKVLRDAGAPHPPITEEIPDVWRSQGAEKRPECLSFGAAQPTRGAPRNRVKLAPHHDDC